MENVSQCCYGVPSGSNIDYHFLSHYEENWLNKYPVEFKPSFYRRSDGDIFVLFEPSESVESFREYVSSKHRTQNITAEQGNIGSLSFLDVKICCKNSKSDNSVCRKHIFTGVFTNYESFILMYRKERTFTHITSLEFQHML